ncbi:MAG: hypothetical protein VZQ98_17220 [Bacteroidales bacterium]|nr:hypothetical protein [Bacteroidales bacterium]
MKLTMIECFNPECHAFIDMSSSQQLNSTSKKNLKKIITGDALGLTDEIVVDYPGRSIGLWAFINPINGVNVTSSCLLEKHRNF